MLNKNVPMICKSCVPRSTSLKPFLFTTYQYFQFMNLTPHRSATVVHVVLTAMFIVEREYSQVTIPCWYNIYRSYNPIEQYYVFFIQFSNKVERVNNQNMITIAEKRLTSMRNLYWLNLNAFLTWMKLKSTWRNK